MYSNYVVQRHSHSAISSLQHTALVTMHMPIYLACFAPTLHSGCILQLRYIFLLDRLLLQVKGLHQITYSTHITIDRSSKYIGIIITVKLNRYQFVYLKLEPKMLVLFSLSACYKLQVKGHDQYQFLLCTVQPSKRAKFFLFQNLSLF